MNKLSFEETEIEGLKIINPFYIEDERGAFVKCFEKDIYKENGLDISTIYEINSPISKKGAVRGLHFQTKNPQSKLLRCVYGKILDVVVDLRKNSKTFGQYHSEILSHENRKMLYIPKGFAHGFICLSDISMVSYLSESKYSPNSDGGIYWKDEELNINWHLDEIEVPIVSEKDKNLMSYRQFCDNIRYLDY